MTENTLERALTSPDFLIELVTNLKHEQEARKLAESKVAEQQENTGGSKGMNYKYLIMTNLDRFGVS